jgi:hypothetical protein
MQSTADGSLAMVVNRLSIDDLAGFNGRRSTAHDSVYDCSQGLAVVEQG